MYRADYHVHSSISPDAVAPMEQMCKGAIEKGCKEIAFTDHFECYTPDYAGYPFDEQYLELYQRELEKNQQMFSKRLIIRRGIELGQPYLDPEKEKMTGELIDLDFIIGSVHKLSNIDLGKIDYKTDTIYTVLEHNLKMLSRMAAESDFDVLGHVNLICRYVSRQGFSISLERERERFAEIFRILVRRGIGIEINTSEKRRGGMFLPEMDLLCLYKEMGGEILTIGSDAHRSEDVFSFITEGAELAKAAGFRYHTTFEKRKPIFHKL